MVTLPTDSITLSKSCYCVGCTTTQSLRVGVEKFKGDNSSGERVPRCVRKEPLQQFFVGDLLQVWIYVPIQFPLNFPMAVQIFPTFIKDSIYYWTLLCLILVWVYLFSAWSCMKFLYFDVKQPTINHYGFKISIYDKDVS